MLTKLTNNRSKWKFQLLRFISLIKSNAFWHYYCYIISFLSIFATAIITISEGSNGALMKRTSRVPTYCLSNSENCDNLSCYIPRRSLKLNRDSHWPILGHMALNKIKCIPIVIHLINNVPGSGYITARDQSMVESVVTEGGKNTPSFLFREWT